MRELTREEKAAIRSLVTKWCANYDREMGCLPLDCECYMLGKQSSKRGQISPGSIPFFGAALATKYTRGKVSL